MLSRTRHFGSRARFWDGSEMLENDESSGRPTDVQTPVMIEVVRELISSDRGMTLRMMEEELEISKETIHKILVEGLGRREFCGRFVPHCWPEEQKAILLQACQDFLQSVDDYRSLLDSVVTGDET
jgi:hypothetical protein